MFGISIVGLVLAPAAAGMAGAGPGFMVAAGGFPPLLVLTLNFAIG